MDRKDRQEPAFAGRQAAKLAKESNWNTTETSLIVGELSFSRIKQTGLFF